MRAQLHRLHSPDVQDLAKYTPTGGMFKILVQAMVGPEGGPGEESFDFLVSSPASVAAEADEKRYVLGRHYLIMKEFDFGLLQKVIGDICRSAIGHTWNEVAAQIARYGKWEFEDYRDS